METLLKADIFFVVTTIAVVLIAIAAIVALVYLIFVLRHLAQLMRRIRREGEEIVDDVRAVREGVESGGAKIQELLLWVGKLVTQIFVGSRRHRDRE